MQVALQGCGSHTNSLVFKIITTGKANIPTIADTNVSGNIECLRELIRITHRLGIEFSRSILMHVNSVSESQ